MAPPPKLEEQRLILGGNEAVTDEKVDDDEAAVGFKGHGVRVEDVEDFLHWEELGRGRR
jgi:hypothetical protein